MPERLPSPKWRDTPNCAGDWIYQYDCSLFDDEDPDYCQVIKHVISNSAALRVLKTRHVRWYGPIPPDPKGAK